MIRDSKIKKIASVLGEATLCDMFNVQATVSGVSDIDNHEGDGNMMTVGTAVVHDKMEFATITIFSQLAKEITDGISYQFTYVNVERYKKKCVLKTTEMTKVTSIKDPDVNILEQDVTQNTKKNFIGGLLQFSLAG